MSKEGKSAENNSTLEDLTHLSAFLEKSLNKDGSVYRRCMELVQNMRSEHDQKELSTGDEAVASAASSGCSKETPPESSSQQSQQLPSTSESKEYSQLPEPASDIPPASTPSPAGGNIFTVGQGDLDPFPRGAGGLLDPRHPVGGAQPPAQPGSGSLVGPNHPIFAGPPQGSGGRGIYDPPGHGYHPDSEEFGSNAFFFPPEYGPPLGSGLRGIGGLPQPRFDPFGPVTGPQRGTDVGNIGPVPGGFGPGRGGYGGRSGSGSNRPFPGEPNPDHFKPPGW